MKSSVKAVILACLMCISVTCLFSCGTDKKTSETTKSTADNGKTEVKMPMSENNTKDMESFKTLELSGDEVTQKVFADHKYTLVDVWGTYCGPCLESMPEIKKVYKNYKSKGLGVMGIVVDVQDENGEVNLSQLELAREIVKDEKLEYPNILIADNVRVSVMGKISSIPTYFFVDSKGRISGELYIGGGRSYEEWCKIIDDKLGL